MAEPPIRLATEDLTAFYGNHAGVKNVTHLKVAFLPPVGPASVAPDGLSFAYAEYDLPNLTTSTAQQVCFAE